MIKTLLSGIALLVSCISVQAAEKPNILFVAIDDLRPELGCYGGSQVQSPHLDKLSSESILFERAYCQVPVCGASRASLMTGMWPTSKRFRTYFTRADEDAPDAATLPETFKTAGYTTLSNGKVFHHREDCGGRSWSEPAWRPDGSGMASFDPATREKLSARKRGRIYELPDVADNAYGDGKVAEKTIADLQRLKKTGKPFFLACGFVKPHMPFYAPKKYWDLYTREDILVADNQFRPKDAPGALKGSGEFKSYHLADFEINSDAWHRMMRHGYLACVSYVDKLVGDVLAELQRLELDDNTIIVVWGDHGWHLGEHNFWGKHNTMHLATRVPLVLKVPGKDAAACKALVETSDLFPTLCALAGIPVPASVQGRSFATLLDEPTQAFRNVVFSRFGAGAAAITRRFSYTRYSGGTSQMLYDLVKDPHENVNIAGKPEHAKIVVRMKKMLDKRDAEADAPKTAPGYEGGLPMPTQSAVRYGEHERHILDFWQAPSESPTPLVFVIHGGGWSGGSKERLNRFADAKRLLAAGISVVAINYRLMRHSQDVVPPVKAPLHDAARALQFVRSKAAEWNIDKQRIGAAGGSAGACSSLWLAFHDDLADPDSEDSVLRESSRLFCAAVTGPQTTLDPAQMKDWTPNSRYGGHAFGKKSFAEFLSDRESILPWIAEYSPYALASAGDPPVYMSFNNTPGMGKEQKDPTHTANFGIGLQARCKELGIACDLVYPGAPDVTFETPTDYLIATLQDPKDR